MKPNRLFPISGLQDSEIFGQSKRRCYFLEGMSFVDRFYLKIGFLLVEFYSENKVKLKVLLFIVCVKHWFDDSVFLLFW